MGPASATSRAQPETRNLFEPIQFIQTTDAQFLGAGWARPESSAARSARTRTRGSQLVPRHGFGGAGASWARIIGQPFTSNRTASSLLASCWPAVGRILSLVLLADDGTPPGVPSDPRPERPGPSHRPGLRATAGSEPRAASCSPPARIRIRRPLPVRGDPRGILTVPMMQGRRAGAQINHDDPRVGAWAAKT